MVQRITQKRVGSCSEPDASTGQPPLKRYIMFRYMIDKGAGGSIFSTSNCSETLRIGLGTSAAMSQEDQWDACTCELLQACSVQVLMHVQGNSVLTFSVTFVDNEDYAGYGVHVHHFCDHGSLFDRDGTAAQILRKRMRMIPKIAEKGNLMLKGEDEGYESYRSLSRRSDGAATLKIFLDKGESDVGDEENCI